MKSFAFGNRSSGLDGMISSINQCSPRREMLN
jgi:hypothetical protein